MQWIDNLSKGREEQTPLKKLQKFTLHDHNFTSKVNEKSKTFTCHLNLKKINRGFQTICRIEGDMKVGKIDLCCWLLDQQHIMHGQWQYQKVQLARFAFRYNQRAHHNVFIRANPSTGELTVCLSYLTGQEIIEDEAYFRSTMTDLCHLIGEESEMIFNTVLEIIFGRQANQPYLQSAIKVNPGFPRYMKVEKLLDKIKSLVLTSWGYKIRSDITTAHKNRSQFKKMYLNQFKKYDFNFRIVQMALLYEPKFSTKYDQCSRSGSSSRDRNSHFIKDYIELEEKNEIQFAKHLNQGYEKQLTQPSIISQAADQFQFEQSSGLYRLTIGNETVRVSGHKMSKQEFQHQIVILEAIGQRHPNMSLHVLPTNLPSEAQNTIFYHYQQEIPLLLFLKKNSRTVSLATKLQIMAEICAFQMHLHKRKIAFFIQTDNLFITRGLEVRVRGFKNAYKVTDWVEEYKIDENRKMKITDMLLSKEQLISFPYRFVKPFFLDNQKCDVMSLGVCLYRILMQKFPFCEGVKYEKEWCQVEWLRMWTVETESFLTKGGEIVKILGYLMLKCMQLEDIKIRPWVEWLLVILCEVRTSLNGLY